jgi:N-acetylglucosamine kinase-like BadF-type ATPase
MRILLAIDGGGTRTRCIAIDPDGVVRGDGSAGPSNHFHVSIDAATEALRAATAEALAAAGAGARDVELVSAGLAGVDYDGAGADEAAGMLHAIGFDRTIVHGDMVIAHRGALAGEPGVVALAGTGSSVLGVAPSGTFVKAGGWGPLYGDQGSAYQLGRLGLVAAAEAFDGSGATTTLLPRLAAALGVAGFRDTMKRLYSDASNQQQVAALAAVVTACAEEGDAVAAAICRRAGAELARLVLAVVRRLSMQETPVSHQGAVLVQSRLVRAAFLEALDGSGMRTSVRSPRFEPVAGAALLGARAAGWASPLAAMEIRGGV